MNTTRRSVVRAMVLALVLPFLRWRSRGTEIRDGWILRLEDR